MITLYDRDGTPIAYSDDNEHIFSIRGEPLAYFYDDKVYSYRGKHLGWFIDGWVRDLGGECAFFTEYASGGPVKPIKHICPTKGVKSIKPIKQTREVARVRPVSKYSWSSLSNIRFFY